jgi:hypothetical protein
VVEDAEVYSGTVGYTDLTVVTRSGEIRRRIDRGPGSRRWPIPCEEHRAKFLECAKVVLTEPSARELLVAIESMGSCADVRALARLSQPAATRPAS